MLGKKPMWENPKREREILLALGKIYQQAQYIFQPREKLLTTQKVVPQKYALKSMPWSI
jgi:hypothetical protein